MMASGGDEDIVIGFHEMGLDDRILSGIAKLGWEKPTLIQQKAIPYFLQGKDLMARARTGSGKTGAYLIPILNSILDKSATALEQFTKAIVTAPTKELCKQVISHIEQLTVACHQEVRYLDVSRYNSPDVLKTLLQGNPDIVVGTPSKLLSHINAGNLNVKDCLQYFVIDEADLMFAFEYKNDLEEILKHLPTICQSFVTSATMGKDVKLLKRLVLHKPVVLKLEEPPLPPSSQLMQYVVKLEELEKAVLFYAIIRLNMVLGKTIIFVNTINRGYKLKMFLGFFKINVYVLNSELPATIRWQVIDLFNSGNCNFLIACDEDLHHAEKTSADYGDGQVKRQTKKDKESGVSRGIDFQLVSNVINFDFPTNVVSYIHRIGRVARGDNEGTALSLVSVAEMEAYTQVEKELKDLMPDPKEVFQSYKYDLKQLDAFRYRASDAWQRCSISAVREFRKEEIQHVMLKSPSLETYFQNNPREKELLKQKKHPKRTMPEYLSDVPEYMIPKGLRQTKSSVTTSSQLYSNAPTSHFYHTEEYKMHAKPKYSKEAKKKYKMSDPLRSFSFSGFKKKKTS